MPTLLITGANRGLGLEFVRQYAADGWDIIATCRAPQKCEAIYKMAQINKKIQLEPLDVTNVNSIYALATKLKGTAIDVLINNAGVFSGGAFTGSANKIDDGQKFDSIDPDAWDKVFKINTIAPILMAQAFTPHLAQGQQRKIVNITSKMGSIAEMGRDYIAYRTSKAALNAAMRTIMHDLQDRKIAIINLHPGWVKTDMGGPEALLEPSVSITGMRKVIADMTLDKTGQFCSYDGSTIAW